MIFTVSSDSISQHQSQANSVGNSHLGVASEVQSYKKILESCAILAFTDAFGKITHVNENFCKISGYTEFELVGQDHRIVNSGFHSKEFFKDLWKTLFAGQIWRGEICNRRKNGSLYWVDTTIIPFENEGPYGSKYIAIRNDITERKRLQQELATEHLRTFVAEKMASLGEMTAGIAHELGNPLAAIQGRAEMLKNRADKESGPLA
jgi:PAS domain S-box-containing protein